MDKSVPQVTVWHHSAEPRDICQKNDPWDRFVHPHLTLMSDSYILAHQISQSNDLLGSEISI